MRRASVVDACVDDRAAYPEVGRHVLDEGDHVARVRHVAPPLDPGPCPAPGRGSGTQALEDDRAHSEGGSQRNEGREGLSAPGAQPLVRDDRAERVSDDDPGVGLQGQREATLRLASDVLVLEVEPDLTEGEKQGPLAVTAAGEPKEGRVKEPAEDRKSVV